MIRPRSLFIHNNFNCMSCHTRLNNNSVFSTMLLDNSTGLPYHMELSNDISAPFFFSLKANKRMLRFLNSTINAIVRGPDFMTQTSIWI